MTSPNKMEVKRVDVPDEVRPFVDKGKLEVLNFERGTVSRATFEPGWRWSQHVKPLAKTESCEVSHLGACLSGRMRVVMNDGAEFDLKPGDYFAIPAGHDAYVVGDEPCVLLDFAGAENYAKEASGGKRKAA